MSVSCIIRPRNLAAAAALSLGLLATSTPARAAVSAAPATVAVFPTQTSASVRLTLTFPPSSIVRTGTLAVTLPPELAGNTTVLPSPTTYSVTLGSSMSTASLRFQTTAGTPVGSWPVAVRDLSLGAGGTTVTLVVRRPELNASVRPSPVELTAGGGPVPLTVRTTAGVGFSEAVRYELTGFPAFLSTGASPTALPPSYPPQVISVEALAGAPAGSYDGLVRGVAADRTAVEIPLRLIVRPPVPVIDRLVPNRLVAGSRGQTVQVFGRNFEAGASIQILPSGPGSETVRIDSARVISSTLARVTLSASSIAVAGRVELELTNPTGGRTPRPGRLALLPPGSPAAPLAVTSLAVVFPRPGAHLAEGETLLPRGLLAVSGSGPISGSWLLDGIPFERFTVRAVAGQPVAVEARTPLPLLARGNHRLSLRVEHPQDISSPEVPLLQTRAKASGLRLLSPQPGAVSRPDELELSWSLVPGAVAYRVEIREVGNGETLEIETSESRLGPGGRSLTSLVAGPYLWRVQPLFAGDVEGTSTPWQPLVLEVGSPTSSHAGPLLGRAALRAFLRSLQEPVSGSQETESHDETGSPENPIRWTSNLEATATGFDGDEPTAPAQGSLAFSGQVAREDAENPWQATAELSYQRPLEGDGEDQVGDQSWIAQGRLGGESLGLDLQVGYSAPRFLEDLHLLDGGLARGGGEARLELPAGLSVSAYASFDPELAASTTGTLEEDQDLVAAALRVGAEEDSFRLQISGLETTQEAGDFSPGSDGEVLGAAGSFTTASGFTFSLEGGRSRTELSDPFLREETEGNSYRLGADGSLGSLSLGLVLRRVEAGYRNPASLDFSEAGPADRDSAELTASLPLGSLSLDLGLSQSEGGDAFGPEGRVRHGELSLSGSAGDGFHFSLGGALTSTTAEEDEEIFLPATDCRDTSLHLELTETLGPFQLSQNASWERQENLLDPFLDSTTTSAGLSAQGTFRRGGLALSLSGTRVAGDASLGVTESLTASLQPSWRLEGLHVSLVPYLSYSETRNDLLLIEDVTEQGQLTLGWDPPWARSLLSLQVSGGWSRSYDRIAEARPDFEAVYRASVTIRWGLERPSGEGVQ